MGDLVAVQSVAGTEERCAAACARCGRMLEEASGSVLGREQLCLRCAVCHPPMLRRSALTALVVGTVLVAINQGSTLVTGHFRPALEWQIPLTFSVPFLVASWGALGNTRISLRKRTRRNGTPAAKRRHGHGGRRLGESAG